MDGGTRFYRQEPCNRQPGLCIEANRSQEEEIMPSFNSIQSRVDDMTNYYGKSLSTLNDLKSNVCTIEETPSHREADLYAKLHPEVLSRSYGCGILVPPALEGARVLDIGCGSGRDVFSLSQLVGPSGSVIGIDATQEPITFARRMTDWHMQVFGYDRPNVEFLVGTMEDLATAGIEDNSVDVVVSNCAINLSAAKERVLKEILRVLRPGGELYFSDIFSDRRLEPSLRDDPVLVAECIGDVMYSGDFHSMMRDLGVREVRAVRSYRKIVRNEEFRRSIGRAQLESRLYRVFKLPLEDKCEDYGQAAVYLGTMEGYEQEFMLDDGHVFETGRAKLVCGNTAMMLADTRYAKHFRVFGDRSRHLGRFEDCADSEPASDDSRASVGRSSCCG